ncbi:nuclear transport factor 2 family protein [Natronosalvus amylolyticus]|uniref:nuclear transport factor 2 family protein n=1 Tax=Natronosalvus amylolyticus TaxID=2961994 RepID=UPI0020C950BE|nr:nuclear transport factor 2 family protein [Natronosalvus amylolyticus]
MGRTDAESHLYELLQTTYFDSIDGGDAETAVEAMHDDVEWTHTQVWEHDGHTSQATDTLEGKAAVHDFLAGRIDEMQAEGIEHKIRDVVASGDKGAFRAAVVGPNGNALPFLGWVELEDDVIRTYTVTPERMPE